MIRDDAGIIIKNSITDVLPDKAVAVVLKNRKFLKNVYVIAVGKAAWVMAKTTKELLGDQIQKGLIITKYGYAKGNIEGFEILEAGHPVPDDNSLSGTRKAIDIVRELGEEDEVLFLLSGGGSSLFEKPVSGITLEDIQEVTLKLLKCGADITEINTIRKRLSDVKGGKFAQYCAPAAKYAKQLGYKPYIISTTLDCEAREAGGIIKIKRK